MLYKVRAIVLGGKDIGEADKLMTLYSEERGKIKAIAKGVRKTRSKFGSSLELFTLSSLLIYSKNNSSRQSYPHAPTLDIISDAQIQNSFRNLRENLVEFAYGNFLVELVNRMTGEEEDDGHRIFHLLREFLSSGRELKNTNVLIYGFTLRFFNILGYNPQIEKCVLCSNEIKVGKGYNFSVNQGGILCNNCKNGKTGVLPVSASSLQYLRQLMRIEPRSLRNLRISLYCERELEDIVQDYLNFYLERDMESLSFLSQVSGLDKSGLKS